MTMLKSFCRMPNLQKITRPVAAAALAALCVVVLTSVSRRLSSPVLADTAPEWLRAAAHQTLPEYPKDTIAVVLLDEEQTTVKDNGDIETRHRLAYKLLRPEARDKYGYAAVQFNNETKVSFFKAWTITADGKEMELKEKDAVEYSLTSFEVFSDQRAKVIKCSAADPGSIVGYEYVQKNRPSFLKAIGNFKTRSPLVAPAFRCNCLPAGSFPNTGPTLQNTAAVFREQFLCMGSRKRTRSRNRTRHAAFSECRQPHGHQILSTRPRPPRQIHRQLERHRNLVRQHHCGQPRTLTRVEQKVAELTAGISDPLKKMQSLPAYVQQQIRYVAIEVGIGGLQPHPAADVFKHQYGDCKDKVTLMSTMLKLAGIDSYYVMIDTRRGIVNPDFPSTRGNHIIMAIRLPQEVPTTNLYATVDDPKLGHLLFFDPTDEFVPLGYLPSELQQNFGLVVTPESGTLFLLPVLPPATNRLLRTATLTLGPTGNLSGDVNELRWGAPADDSRAQFAGSSPSDREKVVEKFLGAFLNNFTLTSASIDNLDKHDANFILHYQFVVEGYAKTAGNLLILRPRVVGEKGSNILAGKSRKYPIEFGGTTLQSDVFDITLPAGYVVDELPQPVDAKCDYASYKSNVEVKDNVLHYKRTYEIKGVVVPTEKLPEVRDFFHQVAAAEKSSAVLRRANP